MDYREVVIPMALYASARTIARLQSNLQQQFSAAPDDHLA